MSRASIEEECCCCEKIKHRSWFCFHTTLSSFKATTVFWNYKRKLFLYNFRLRFCFLFYFYIKKGLFFYFFLEGWWEVLIFLYACSLFSWVFCRWWLMYAPNILSVTPLSFVFFFSIKKMKVMKIILWSEVF